MSGKALHLTVLVGAAVEPPTRPLSPDALGALTSVSVQAQSEGRTGFQLTFETDRRRVVDDILKRFQFGLNPAVRVVIMVTLGGVLHILSDGVVTQHQNVPTAAGKTTLSFTGEDLSVLMDLVDKSGTPLAGLGDLEQVNTILAPYSSLGIIPSVIPSPLIDLKDPTDGTPQQTGTDYSYVNGLARKVGYVFYLDPGPALGGNIAYWGPEIQASIPQPALTIGAGLSNNVISMSFTHATQQKSLPLISLHIDKIGTLTIPLPDVNPLRPPLTAVPQPPVRVDKSDDNKGKLSPIRAVSLALARASRTGDNVTASGQLDVRSYGRLLRPRRLVGVRGATLSYDGLYYVTRVSTELRRGRCTQSFNLKRSGAFPNVPRIPV